MTKKREEANTENPIDGTFVIAMNLGKFYIQNLEKDEALAIV